LFTTSKRIALSGNAEHIVTKDSAGNSLTGEKNYHLYLPAGIPASNFWSVIVYDNLTRLMIQTDQPWSSVHCRCKKLLVNQDGSMDVWFGPKAPSGRENNWIQTIPGKGWNMILRLYDPLEAWVNGTWKPGEIEEVK
jgi:hypothetical protein